MGRLYNYEGMYSQRETSIGRVLTSLHIVKYECEARDTKLGPEEITRDYSNLQ